MSSSVVVSRIQNRRGTQEQFDGYSYTLAGPNSVYPIGYTGVGGYDSFPDFTAINYPNVLLQGELALCTDSRRIFVGNQNGEYLELEVMSDDGLMLAPSVWVLPPSVSFAPITKNIPALVSPFAPYPVTLGYEATQFLTLLYSVTDASSVADWNAIGPTFSKNGELKITAIDSATPLPAPPPPAPLPPLSRVTLTDTSTEINFLDLLSDIHFIAKYNGPNIEIWYKHDFPTSLIFSTDTIRWIPFIP